jgi:seryl-tRNA synthetase
MAEQNDDDQIIRKALDIFSDQRSKYVEYDDKINELKKRIRDDQEKLESLISGRKAISSQFYNILQQFAKQQEQTPPTHPSSKRKKVSSTDDEYEQAIKQRLDGLLNDQATGLADNIKLFKHNQQTNTFTCNCETLSKLQLETAFTMPGQKRLLTLISNAKTPNQYNVVFEEPTKHIVTEFIIKHM